MQALTRPFGTLHLRIDGPETAPAVLIANSLGTDLRLWEPVLPLLPQGLRIIRYDKRGHGLSSIGGGRDLADHAADVIAIIEEVAKGPVIMIGLSIGGLIAQRVAADRPDLVRALVLSNTAARLGTAESWQTRIDAIEKGGLESIADMVMERWFGPAFLATAELPLWRNMLTRTSVEGYIAACRALAGADQISATEGLRLPTIVIAGSEDGASSPEIVRATAELIQGAEFRLLKSGHIPCVEVPADWAAAVNPFLRANL